VKGVLAILAIALALPGRGFAGTQPLAPTAGAPPVVSACTPPCADGQGEGDTRTTDGTTRAAPAEDAAGTEVVLLVLLASLLLIVPVIVTRQRQRNASDEAPRSPSPRSTIRLVWSRPERRTRD